MSDRGVNEVLGFVLVFAIVTGSTAVVYTVGVSGLHDAQRAEKFDNVQRAFDVLADNLADLYRSGPPSRATEIKLAGGTLRTGDPVRIQIDAVDTGNLSNNATYAAKLQPIEYDSGRGTKLVYSSGAVIRSRGSGAVIQVDPQWVVGPNRSAIPLVSTYGAGGSISGDGAVLVVAQSGTRTLYEPIEPAPGATTRVNVTVTSPRAVAWQRFFQRQGYHQIDGDATDGNVTYQFTTDELYVSRTAVEVSFDR